MSYRCRSCGNTFLQEPTCATCGAEKLYDATVLGQAEQIERLTAEVESLREALGTVVYELAALIPKPASPTEPGWPVENPADAKCLQLAYVAARTAIAKAEGRDAT